MSLDRIEPIRVVSPPRIERVPRERDDEPEDRRREPDSERERHDESEPDDGLPHIDVRA